MIRFRAVLIAASLCAVPPAVAQASVSPRFVPGDSTEARSPAMRTRIYVGMWSTHLRDINEGLDGNSLIGFAYRGFFGATFINSFGDRAVCLGLQRDFTPAADGVLTTGIGYRLGLITGYDERFFGIGDNVPVIPFIQLVGVVDYRNLGVELAYAGIVASLTLSVRL